MIEEIRRHIRCRWLTTELAKLTCAKREEPSCWCTDAECTIPNKDIDTQVECLLINEFIDC